MELGPDAAGKFGLGNSNPDPGRWARYPVAQQIHAIGDLGPVIGANLSNSLRRGNIVGPAAARFVDRQNNLEYK